MVLSSNRSGSNFFEPSQVNFLWLGLSRVRSAIYGSGLESVPWKFPFGSKKSLWVVSKSTRVKGGSASYLLRVKSKLGLGQGMHL